MNAILSSIANYDDVLVSLTADVASTYVLIRTIKTYLGNRPLILDKIESQG